jgi:micrococcal nuclease
MRKLTLSFLIIFSLAFLIYNFNELNLQGKAVSQEKTVVTNVIDGDTVVITGGERVRLLGIDTPEKGEFYYKEAKARLEQLAEKKEVFVEKERDDKDKYDRLLRYIFINNTNINLKLVEEGYANCYFYQKSKYQETCKALEEKAQKEKIGIWGK